MKNIIKDLEQIITEYTPQLRQLTESDSSFKPSPSKWSGKEYLGHLIDSAQSNIRRFVVAQYEDKPHIVYAQEMGDRFRLPALSFKRPYRSLDAAE